MWRHTAVLCIILSVLCIHICKFLALEVAGEISCRRAYLGKILMNLCLFPISMVLVPNRAYTLRVQVWGAWMIWTASNSLHSRSACSNFRFVLPNV